MENGFIWKLEKRTQNVKLEMFFSICGKNKGVPSQKFFAFSWNLYVRKNTKNDSTAKKMNMK